MYNLLIGIAAGIAVTLAIRFGTTVGWIGSVVPGLVAAIGVYFVLARRTWKQLEALFEEVQRELQAQRIEKAVKVLERGFALAPWQFLVASQVHAQIGVLQYVKGDLDASLPHLEKAFSRHWLARAMLGAARFRKNDLAGMQSAFEQTVKVSKKEGLAWAAYAWCLEDRDRHDDAVKVLGRAVATNPSDEKLKTALQTLQNGKKLKLGKLYGEQWYQFRLEAMPPQFASPAGSMRGSRRAIYGKR
jgi:tetratricopeptide (TPR) repeat protein